MTGPEFKERLATLLQEELRHPYEWYYLSFADTKFNGGVVIRAHGITDAILRCNVLGINPGGEVRGVPIPPEAPMPSPEFCNRLLSKEDILTFWPDAKTIKEFEEEQQKEAT